MKFCATGDEIGAFHSIAMLFGQNQNSILAFNKIYNGKECTDDDIYLTIFDDPSNDYKKKWFWCFSLICFETKELNLFFNII